MDSSFLMGGLAALAAFNFLLFLNTKDRGYLYYALFLALFHPYFHLAFPVSNRNELSVEPRAYSWLLDLVIVAIALSFSSFIRVFFSIKTDHSRFYRLMFYMDLALISNPIFHNFFWHNLGDYFVKQHFAYCFLFMIALNITILVYILIVFAFSIWKYLKGFTAAKFFVLANLSAFVGIGARIFAPDALNIISELKSAETWLQMGLFFQSVLFSMALADKINLLKRQIIDQQKLKAQIEKQKLEEIAHLTEIKNQELIEKVAERTAQLSESNQELLTISEELRSSLDQKQVLLKEIHHRVKNNLQIVSSLLNLQTQHIKDPKTLSAIKEGQNRVISMALVHQKLYQTENLARVEIGDFLKPLLQHLHESFAAQSQNIAYNLTFNETWLDLDRVIPIGLIVNEWVSNAYKYAFEGRESGQIKIDFTSEANTARLTVKDNGVGKIEQLENKTGSLGLRLVKMLSAQIDAQIGIEDEDGLSFHLTFAL